MEHCNAEMQKNDMTHKLLQAKNKEYERNDRGIKLAHEYYVLIR